MSARERGTDSDDDDDDGGGGSTAACDDTADDAILITHARKDAIFPLLRPPPLSSLPCS